MIGFFFRKASRARIKEKEYEFAAQHLGAEVQYTGRAPRAGPPASRHPSESIHAAPTDPEGNAGGVRRSAPGSRALARSHDRAHVAGQRARRRSLRAAPPSGSPKSGGSAMRAPVLLVLVASLGACATAGTAWVNQPLEGSEESPDERLLDTRAELPSRRSPCPSAGALRRPNLAPSARHRRPRATARPRARLRVRRPVRAATWPAPGRRGQDDRHVPQHVLRLPERVRFRRCERRREGTEVQRPSPR